MCSTCSVTDLICERSSSNSAQICLNQLQIEAKVKFDQFISIRSLYLPVSECLHVFVEIKNELRSFSLSVLGAVSGAETLSSLQHFTLSLIFHLLSPIHHLSETWFDSVNAAFIYFLCGKKS